jgi:hypothetical protein
MSERDLQGLERIVGAHGRFGHHEHVELAWTYLGRYRLQQAADAMSAAVRHLASEHGMPDRYHETITRSWVRLVDVHRRDSDARSFDEFIAGNSGLLDRQLMERHYSRELIASHGARAAWTEPDLRPLPGVR